MVEDELTKNGHTAVKRAPLVLNQDDFSKKADQAGSSALVPDDVIQAQKTLRDEARKQAQELSEATSVMS